MRVFGTDTGVSMVDDCFFFQTQKDDHPLVLPAYVAVQTGTTKILARGEEARAMLGREPSNISVQRVLEEGVVTDPEAAQSLFRFGLRELFGGNTLTRPRVIIALRLYEPGIQLVKNIAIAGGAREAYMMDMSVATAIGMQLDVQKPEVKAVLVVSDDWSDFGVISLAGLLTSTTGAIGMRSFVEDIRNHLTLSRQFQPHFESITQQLQSTGVRPGATIDMPGWETWQGRAEHGRLRSDSLSSDELTLGMMPSLVRLTERIKTAIRALPDEKQYQLSRTTIHATGMAMRIPGLAELIAQELGHSVTPFSGDIHPSIKGCRDVLNELDFLGRVKAKGR